MRTIIVALFLVIIVSLLVFVITSKDSTVIPVETESLEDMVQEEEREPDEVAEEVEAIPVQFLIRDDSYMRLRDARIEIRDVTGNAITSLKTNRNGEAEFSSHEETITYQVSHASCFPVEAATVELESRLGEPIEIQLPRKYLITGEIVSATGETIENAQIECVSSREKEKAIKTSSDEEGRFRIFPLRYGSYLLRASHPSYLQTEREVHVDQEEITLVLHHHFKLVVQAFDEQGSIVPGASINVVSSGTHGFFADSKLTNSIGRAVFTDMVPMEYRIEGTAPFSSSTEQIQIAKATEEQVDVDLFFQRGTFSIFGKVIDSSSHRGIASVTVVCEASQKNANQAFPKKVQSDGQGDFQLHGLPVGRYTIYAERIKGYISGKEPSAAFYGAEQPSQLSQFVDEDIEDFRLYLDPAYKIHGTVYDPNQKPMSDILLKLSLSYHAENRNASGGGNHRTSVQCYSDEEGKFTMEVPFHIVDSFTNVYVTAFAKDYYQKSSGSIQLEKEKKDYYTEIIFELKNNIKGKIEDEKGNPIVDAEVILFTVDKKPFYTDKLEMKDQIDMKGYTRSDKNGEYATYCSPGTWKIGVLADGYRMQEDLDTTVEILENQTTTKNFVLIDEEAQIRGKVLSLENEPIADVDMYIIESIENSIAAPREDEKVYSFDLRGLRHATLVDTTNQEGEFGFDTPRSIQSELTRMYKIIAVPGSERIYGPEVVSNVRAGDQVTIQLDYDKRGSIRGRVLDVFGQPLRQFDLIVISSFDSIFTYGHVPNYHWHYFSSPNGDFLLKDIEPEYSPIHLAVKNEEWGLALSEPIVMHEQDSIQDVVIQYENPITLSGQVIDSASKEPIHEAKVKLNFMTDPDYKEKLYSTRFGYLGHFAPHQGRILNFFPEAKTDEEGRFRLQDVPNEPLWLSIHIRRYNPKIIPIYPTKNQSIQLGEILLMGKQPSFTMR